MSTPPQPLVLDTDHRFMRLALGLAQRGLGMVWPNPAVGCVLVRAEQVVGRGWTQPGGRPHAETEALRRAGAAARGATAYVTLEPCNHHGQTPPCSEALVTAGVQRVVVAVHDPDPRVCGTGLARLEAAGLAVTCGVEAEAAAELNAGFFLRIQHQRPLFTLKLATTLDGRIATHRGESRWITGPMARNWGHALRASHDAIMIGIGTALADNPDLTCRLPGLEARSPVRLVVDSWLRLPLTSRLVQSAAERPTWIIARNDVDPPRRRTFQSCGVEVLGVPPDASGTPDLTAAAAVLAERGLTRVLVEGGSHLAASLVRHDFVDRIEWFRAARLMGGDGVPALVGFGVDRLAQTPEFERRAVQPVGEDCVERYVRRAH